MPCGSENSYKVLLPNPNEDKLYILTYKKSPKSIRATARNPNIDLQPMGIFSKSDIQHHINMQQFQELLTKMDTMQRQSVDHNLRKLSVTAGFSDIYRLKTSRS